MGVVCNFGMHSYTSCRSPTVRTNLLFLKLRLLLIVCILFASLSEVGDVVGVADSTIRQSYRLLYPAREELFPTDFKFVTPLDQLPKH